MVAGSGLLFDFQFVVFVFANLSTYYGNAEIFTQNSKYSFISSIFQEFQVIFENYSLFQRIGNLFLCFNSNDFIGIKGFRCKMKFGPEFI